jgi:manganese/zinc/iron transport system permease protein
MHYALMSMLSLVVVSAFQSVGAILVIAMLILPGATSYLLTQRLQRMLLLSFVHSALSSVAGMHLAIWLNCSMAAAMVVAGSVLFLLAWVFSPSQGLLWSRWRRLAAEEEREEPLPEPASVA